MELLFKLFKGSLLQAQQAQVQSTSLKDLQAKVVSYQ
jgi:hypothetical protein